MRLKTKRRFESCQVTALPFGLKRNLVKKADDYRTHGAERAAAAAAASTGGEGECVPRATKGHVHDTRAFW